MPFDSARNEKSRLFSDLIGFEDIERDGRRGRQAGAAAAQHRNGWLHAELPVPGSCSHWLTLAGGHLGLRTANYVMEFIQEKGIGTERKWTQPSERQIRGI